jgi:hypothetical protein
MKIQETRAITPERDIFFHHREMLILIKRVYQSSIIKEVRIELFSLKVYTYS